MSGLDLLIFRQMRDLLLSLFPYLVTVLLPGLWCAWWLWGVNWIKLWPTLAKGAWVPVVLLTLVAAGAWTQLQPSQCDCLGFMTIPNGWWQLGTVALLVATALFCGWLQGYFGWMPEEISVEPPAQEHGFDHGHAHAHH
jgi:hypothetical protein